MVIIFPDAEFIAALETLAGIIIVTAKVRDIAIILLFYGLTFGNNSISLVFLSDNAVSKSLGGTIS
jgi:hypothetical protein